MLSRRKIIVSTVQSILALGSIPYLTGCSQDDDVVVVEQSESPSLLEYALGMEGISFIGEACIKEVGFDRSTPDEVLQGILTDKLQNRFVASGITGSFQQQLDVMIRKDFNDDHVVNVEGWILSDTECQVIALAASLQGYRQAKLPVKAQPILGQIVEVENWGPKSTIQGETFNEQPDGHSGLWFKASGASISVDVVFANVNQTTAVYSDLITSGIRGKFMHEVINTPGDYSVALYDKSTRMMQPLGTFQVVEPGLPAHNMDVADLDKCIVEEWGPNHADAGKAFNPQPGGVSAFWVKTNCALDGSTLILDGVNLETAVSKNVLTALVPRGHRMAPGNYELGIKLGFSERILKAGLFRVE